MSLSPALTIALIVGLPLAALMIYFFFTDEPNEKSASDERE